jgi:hypothetical protein
MKPKHLIICLLALASTACSHTANAPAGTDDVAAARNEDNSLSLPLPTIPPSITDGNERAAYLATHFWDAMEWADTTRSHNRDFVEQNFANFLAVFPAIYAPQQRTAVEGLLAEARTERGAYELVRTVAAKYLYDPNSPMYNEDEYALFVDAYVADDSVPEADRVRYAHDRKCIAMNRPGSDAPDFAYADRNGERHTLRATAEASAEAPLMVMFYDPECDECKKTIAALADDDTLNALLDDGRLNVLALCIEGDYGDWRKSAAELPSDWMSGFDRTGIDDKELYVIRATPAIYLVDNDGRILLKDCQPREALLAAANYSAQ